jgi:hypothetical protein
MEPDMNPYLGLRDLALRVKPEEIGLSVSAGEPYGVLMETGYSGAVATLVAFGEGTASLYFSSGGGILGGGNHEAVRQAANHLVTAAGEFLPIMERATAFPLPTTGQTRFYVITPSGIFTFAAAEQDLGNHRSDLSPLFYVAHSVITALRVISEKAPG